jgi:dihydroorotate dehydrogenase (fumarate)
MEVDLKTNYAGLKLKNPIIIGANNLVMDQANLLKLEQAGAAAIVFRSLFEEQVMYERSILEGSAHSSDASITGNVNWPVDHLLRLKNAKQALTIPLIGSLNCITTETWAEYAIKMAETGIDALELNFYSTEMNLSIDAQLIEAHQLSVVGAVKRAVRIPVTVKLSPYYTNPLLMISELDRSGIDGLVLFNRLFQPDIDIEKEVHQYPYNLSMENDNRLSLRFAGLLYGKTVASVCCNTGILSGKDVIKMILAGASSVQVVSAVYRHGIDYIVNMLDEIRSWMNRKNYSSIKEFQGKLSKGKLSDPFVYMRAQYVEALAKSGVKNN